MAMRAANSLLRTRVSFLAPLSSCLPAAPLRCLFSTVQEVVAKASTDGAVQAARSLDAGALPMPDPSLIHGMAMPLKISQLVDQVSSLSLVECMLFSEGMRKRLNMPSDLMLTTASAASAAAAAVAAGGAAAGAGGAAAKAGPGGAAAAAAAAAPAAAPAAEKTTVDIKLLSFKAESKIKVIKEVRSITSLGLKEAKELVEGAPCVLMQKVKREDAVKMLEKLKAETGAECELI